MASFLVTGGAGFIGSHIVEALLKQGEAVRVFDNFSTGKRENLAGLSGAQIIEGDLRDLDAVRSAAAGVDVVFHEGALPSVARSLVAPHDTYAANVLGTLNVLVAARDARVRRLVFAGSSSVYGDDPVFPRQEDAAPRTLSPYAASKLAAEALCTAFASSFGLSTVTLRYFNVFGPRQDGNSPYSGVIAKFAMDLLKGEIPAIEGDGGQSRDFTYVDNVVQANLLAARADIPGGKVINVATGSETSVLELFQALCRILGKDIQPRFLPSRVGDVRRSLASIRRAEELLGYRPQVDFQEGLARTVAWYATRAGTPIATVSSTV